MKTTRQAVLLVSRQLLESIMPDWETAAQLRYGDVLTKWMPKDVESMAAPYHAALKLPDNCRITGISSIYAFNRDEIAFRVESPDFREAQEGCTLPEVRAVYRVQHKFTVKSGVEPDGGLFTPGLLTFAGTSGYFFCWENAAAVAVRREYGPDGKEALPFVDLAKAAESVKKQPLVEGPGHIGTYVVPDGVPIPPSLYCWRCGIQTARWLPDGTAECEECAGKGLL